MIICLSYPAALISAFMFVFTEDLLTVFFLVYYEFAAHNHRFAKDCEVFHTRALVHSSLVATQTQVDFL